MNQWKTWAEGRPTGVFLTGTLISGNMVCIELCASIADAMNQNKTHWAEAPDLPVRSQEQEDDEDFQQWRALQPGASLRLAWLAAKRGEREAIWAEWVRCDKGLRAFHFDIWLARRCGRETK